MDIFFGSCRVWGGQGGNIIRAGELVWGKVESFVWV